MSPASAIAARLAPMTVLSQEGVATPLGTFWSERAAVLVWVRHFG